MSLPQEIKAIYLRQEKVAHTVPATYGAGAHNVLAIQGGPVQVLGMIEYLDTALAGATTTTLAIGALAMDGGLLAINAGGQYSVCVSPMDSAGVIAKVATAMSAPLPSLLGLAAGGVGVVAGQGQNITWTFGGVAMGALELVSLYVIYRPLSEDAFIA